MIKRPNLFKASNPTQAGRTIEQEAAAWLTSRKLQIVERNFRSRFGEIDLIAWHGQTLVFVEVRFRQHRGYGGAEMSVDRRKQKRLFKTAQLYLLKHPKAQTSPCRFDVLAVSLDNNALDFNWLKDAFTATDLYPDAF